MKLFVGHNDAASLRNAEHWLNDEQDLHRLDVWARAKEPEWGECYIFLEVSLPKLGPSNHLQMDLLVAFQARGALCELKKHASLQHIHTSQIADQVSGEQQALESVLRTSAFRGNFTPILLFPRLALQELLTLNQQLVSVHSRPDISVTGSPSRLPYSDPRSGQFNFLRVLERKLSNYPLETRGFEGQCGVQQSLEKILREKPRELFEFESSKGALGFLQATYGAPHVPFPAAYVPETREEELTCAKEAIHGSGIIEIAGPPGIGKSVLACEILASVQKLFHEISLPKIASADRIAEAIEEEIEGGHDRRISTSTLIERLARFDAVYWIRSYEDQSRNSLLDFLGRVQSVRPRRSLWIVESVRSLRDPTLACVQLGPVKRSALALILSQVRNGTLSTSVEAAIDGSHGNPRDGLCLLRTGSIEKANSFEWLEAQLSRNAKRVLRLLCLIMLQAPLGLSRRIIEQTAREIFADLPYSDITRAVVETLATLEQEQLGSISRFEPRQFGGVLDGIITAGIELVHLNALKRSLLEAFSRQIPPEQKSRWMDAYFTVLIAQAEAGNLADVTYNILHHELQPFFRSSFRFTSLGVTLGWMETAEWEPPDPRQAYLLRCLRVLSALNRDSQTRVRQELGDPDAKDGIQIFAQEYVLARQMTVLPLSDLDLEEFITENQKRADIDLQAAYAVSCASALLAAGRASDALRLLTRTGKTAKDSSAGVILRIQMGDLLNRKEGKDAAGEKKAAELSRLLSRDLIEAGIKLENVHLICSGAFYYVRGLEFEAGRRKFMHVLQYLAALDWIEQVPGARARWRMRVLLTRGSLHRHYLREDSLLWPEFQEHLELAWHDYMRAWHTAFSAKHVLHSLNSAVYMSGVCKSAMRYGKDQSTHSVVLDYCRQASEICDLAVRNLRAKGPKELPIMESVERALPLLRYVLRISMSSEPLNAKVESLEWERYFGVAAKGRQRSTRMKEKQKHEEEITKEIYRVLRFADFTNPTRFNESLEHFRPWLLQFRDAAQAPSSDSWRKLTDLTKLSPPHAPEGPLVIAT